MCIILLTTVTGKSGFLLFYKRHLLSKSESAISISCMPILHISMYKYTFMLNICVGADKPEGLEVYVDDIKGVHFCKNLVLLWLPPHINANVCSQVFI